jgi:hypothetical protein
MNNRKCNTDQKKHVEQARVLPQAFSDLRNYVHGFIRLVQVLRRDPNHHR